MEELNLSRNATQTAQSSFLVEAWTWTGVQLTIGILGSCMNALVIYAILKFKALQSSMNFQIFSLATASLMFDMLVMPSGSIGLIAQWYNFRPKKWCHYYTPIHLWLLSTVSYHLALISVNRFLAVVFAHRYRRLKSRKVTLLFVLPCWIWPFFVSLLGFTVGSFWAAPPFGYCLPSSENRKLTLLIQTTMVYIPTIVMGISYSAIFLKFSRIRRGVRPVVGNRWVMANQQRLLRKRLRTSQTIFLCFLVFCLNYYPASLIYLINPGSVQLYPYLFLWLRSLAQTATLVNPVGEKRFFCRPRTFEQARLDNFHLQISDHLHLPQSKIQTGFQDHFVPCHEQRQPSGHRY
jgi:7 transmembrane receptor (rhodopsin family)